MRILEAEPKQLDNKQLQELIVSLRRSESDLRKRLAGQVAVLEGAGRMRPSNPVYQSLYFLLQKFSKQLSRAEREVEARGVEMNASRRQGGRTHIESNQRDFDPRTVKQATLPSNLPQALP